MALSGASREDAKTFLEKQGALLDKQGHLVDLQCEYLADKDKFELSHLRWRRFTEQTKGALQALTAMVGIAVAVGIGLMRWQAAHSDGLRVEPFGVPPDLAANGLTGQVVAARMIDRLSELQSQTNTGRPARTYSNSWGDKAIKLEIPEAGISLEELDSWPVSYTHLRAHETGRNLVCRLLLEK